MAGQWCRAARLRHRRRRFSMSRALRGASRSVVLRRSSPRNPAFCGASGQGAPRLIPTQMGPCSHDSGTPPPLGFSIHRKNAGQRKEEAMIARFDHRPMLTALLALTTTLLVVVVITLSTLLLTAPPAATSASESGGAANPGAIVQ